MKVQMALVVGMLMGSSVLAGPAAKDPVAEGFADFDNVNDKHFVTGRAISASDLRQRVAVVVEMDAAAVQKTLLTPGMDAFTRLDNLPAAHESVWDSIEFPRNMLVVVSLRGNPKFALADWRAALKPSKKDDEEQSRALQVWSAPGIAVYNEAKLVNEPDNGGKYPFAYVMGPSGAEPIWKGSIATKAAITECVKAARKAEGELPQWKPLTGVTEVKYFKNVEKLINEGKPFKPCFGILKASLKDKDAEKAKEAQIMYDALWQFRSDTRCRIALEFVNSPARAYVDAQQLFKRFPADKKALQELDLKLKANKELVTIGKMYEKVIVWSHPDFVVKNAGEAKKIVAEITNMRKIIEKATKNENAQIAGSAMLIQSQLETLADVIPTKVPGK